MEMNEKGLMALLIFFISDLGEYGNLGFGDQATFLKWRKPRLIQTRLS